MNEEMTPALLNDLDGLMNMIETLWGSRPNNYSEAITRAKALLEHSDWNKGANARLRKNTIFRKPLERFRPGIRVYAVGGCIRDYFLGRVPDDMDYVVVGATEQDMLDAGLTKVGADFHVYINRDGSEFALARTERKVGNGYKGFVTETDNVTIEEDLSRRDFTINALAYDFEEDRFVDPLGGFADLRNKVIRMANEHTFIEDPLRILRLARFAARFPYFSIDADTIDIINNMPNKQEELGSISPERVTLEFEKMWKQEAYFGNSHIRMLDGAGPSIFFDTLNKYGALEILVPELYVLKDIQEPLEHHPEGCTYLHIMMALEKAKEAGLGVNEFWMILTHDFGKVLTADTRSHHGHDKDGVPIVEAFCSRFKLSAQQTSLCKLFCEHHMRLARINEMKPFTIAKMLNLFKVEHTLNIIESMVRCSIADQTGRYKESEPSFSIHEITKYINAYTAINGEHVTKMFKSRNKPIPQGDQFKHELLILRAKEIHIVKNIGD